MSRGLWRVAAIGLSALVVVGCWLPSDDVPPQSDLAPDTLLHFVAFFVLGFAWHRAGLRPRTVLLLGIALILLTEGGQALLGGGRAAEWSDAGADLVGCLGGLLASRFVQRSRRPA